MDSTAAAPSKEENENEDVAQGPMFAILSTAQLNETFHKVYVKELKQLYSKMDHDAFGFPFIKILQTVRKAEESHECGKEALSFCVKFATSFESEQTHPMLAMQHRPL